MKYYIIVNKTENKVSVENLMFAIERGLFKKESTAIKALNKLSDMEQGKFYIAEFEIKAVSKYEIKQTTERVML